MSGIQSPSRSFGHAHECFLSETAGFLPETPPIDHLPEAYRDWDQLALELPQHVSELRVAQAVQTLSEFDAYNLPEAYLCRAASLLGIFAHTLIREQQLLQLAPLLPEKIEAPWRQICQSLGRPGSGMTYSDLILYNWRLKDPDGPRRVQNMDLMTAVYGSQEERLFYLVMVETHASATPLVSLVKQMQAACHQGDISSLKQALHSLSKILQTMTFKTLLKIDPNPYSRYFVDHLIWARTVAPFAFPVKEGELGLSGGGSPVFHVLDALFGRSQWQTQIGHELLALQKWMPAGIRDFIQQAADLNLGELIQKEPTVAGAYRNALEAYTGERGWLGMHRLKVYGFMEVGFKAGRTQTNGGFSGQIAQRAWEALDDSIESARLERLPAQGSACPFAKQQGIRQVASAPIFQVKLESQDLDFEPGDRLGIWPQNHADMIAKTLAALQATGDEPVLLTASWKHVMAKTGLQVSESIPLKLFLAHAKLRPLLRPVGKQLLKLVHIPELKRILDQRQEDRYEVWEVLELMQETHYDTRRLWQAGPWQSENLSRILPPENVRIYSISSDNTFESDTQTLELTIGALHYRSEQLAQNTPIERNGAASHFLTHPQSDMALPVQVIKPSRFALPKPDCPIFMFAGGTGISPFRGFWQARRQASAATYLFVGTQNLDSLAYYEELQAEVNQHDLRVQVCFSRQDQQLRSRTNTSEQTGSFLSLEAAPKAYVDQAVRDHTEVIWQALQSFVTDSELADKTPTACFYICGQTRFAHTVIQALQAVIAENLQQAPGSQMVQDAFRRLVANGRLMMDIFTTFAPSDQPGVKAYQVYNASEVMLHNQPETGYWSVIQGQVYDLSEFLYLHPGGARLLKANAGLDTSRSYEKVNHHLNSEVHAMLDLYKIGKIRRLHFGEAWSATLMPKAGGDRPETAMAKADGLMYFRLEDLYTQWMRYAYLIVEIENSLTNNCELGQSNRLLGLPEIGPFHLAMQIEILQLFGDVSLLQLTNQDLDILWHMTLASCDPQKPLHLLACQLGQVQAQWQSQHQNLCLNLRQKLVSEPDQLRDTLNSLLNVCLSWLAEYKLHIRQGIQAFEAHESQTPQQAGDLLVSVLSEIPDRLKNYGYELSRFCL